MTLPLEDAAEPIGPVGHLVACLNVITSTDAALRERQWASLAGLARPGGRVLVVVPSVESALHVMRVADEADDRSLRRDTREGLFPRGDDRRTQKHYTDDELRKRSTTTACGRSLYGESTTRGPTRGSRW